MFVRKKLMAAAGLMALLTVTSAVAPLPPAGVSAAPSPLPAERSMAGALMASRLALDFSAAAQTIAVPEDKYGVRVDGIPVVRDPMVTEVDGVTYLSLSAMGSALLPGSTYSWDGAEAALRLEGVLDLTAAAGQCYLTANGRYLYLEQGILVQDDEVLIPLAVLAKAMDAQFTFREDGSLDFTSGSGAISPAEDFYSAEDLYWLSHIIYAESGNQPLKGKMAVGNVVLNRVADSYFPNTIYAVVFQKYQFTPASNGAIYAEPNEESVLAAKLCLDGGVALENVLYFNRAGLASWASRNRSFVATIAGHTFYA